MYDRNEIEDFLIENYYFYRKKPINHLYKKFNNNIKWIYYTEFYYKFYLNKIYVSNYGDLIIKKYYTINLQNKNVYKIFKRRNEFKGIELNEEDKDISKYIKKLSNKEIINKIDERLLEKYEKSMMKLNDTLNINIDLF
jgi:hypothetical protein